MLLRLSLLSFSDSYNNLSSEKYQQQAKCVFAVYKGAAMDKDKVQPEVSHCPESSFQQEFSSQNQKQDTVFLCQEFPATKLNFK